MVGDIPPRTSHCSGRNLYSSEQTEPRDCQPRLWLRGFGPLGFDAAEHSGSANVDRPIGLDSEIDATEERAGVDRGCAFNQIGGAEVDVGTAEGGRHVAAAKALFTSKLIAAGEEAGNVEFLSRIRGTADADGPSAKAYCHAYGYEGYRPEIREVNIENA